MQRKPLNGCYTVGLLGGSFNPAHEGHVHLSETVRKKLGLRAVWWLVSPGNPLKKDHGDYQNRTLTAKKAVESLPFYSVSTIENQLGTRYTLDTIQRLKKRFPHIRFVWLMGADNLVQFHRWKGFKTLFNTLPIVIFDRSPNSYTAQKSKAALCGAHLQRRINHFSDQPRWHYLHGRRHNAASSNLRCKQTP